MDRFQWRVVVGLVVEGATCDRRAAQRVQRRGDQPSGHRESDPDAAAGTADQDACSEQACTTGEADAIDLRSVDRPNQIAARDVLGPLERRSCDAGREVGEVGPVPLAVPDDAQFSESVAVNGEPPVAPVV